MYIDDTMPKSIASTGKHRTRCDLLYIAAEFGNMIGRAYFRGIYFFFGVGYFFF